MSKVKISRLPVSNTATDDDYFVINDANQETQHISWSDLKITLTSSNLTFTGTTYFKGPTFLDGQVYYTQAHLNMYPGLSINQDSINEWNEAYSWGNHADEGYLTSFTPEQSDWAETDTSKYTFIKNKPLLTYDGIYVGNIKVDLGYRSSATQGVITNTKGSEAIIPPVSSSIAGLMTPYYKNKIDQIGVNQVQSDWAETDQYDDAFILNKPTINYDIHGNISNVSVDLGYITAVDQGTVTAGDGSTAVVPLVVSKSGTRPGTAGLMDPVRAKLVDELPTDSNGDLDLPTLELDFDVTWPPTLPNPEINLDANGNVTNIEVNLGYTPSPGFGVVTSDKGSNATILLVDDTNAGLMSPTQYSFVEDLIDNGNATSLTGELPIVIDDTNPIIPQVQVLRATQTDDGVMLAADKLKLDGIEDGAQVNVDPEWDDVQNKPSFVEDLNDLADVNVGEDNVSASVGDVLAYGPTGEWVPGSPSSVLQYGGLLDVTVPAPTPPNNPTIYLVEFDGTADATFGNISGNTVQAGDRVLYDTVNTDWYLFNGNGGAAAVDLSIQQTSTNSVTVVNSGGTNATIAQATSSVAGVMTSTDKAKLNNLDNQDLGATPSENVVDLTITNGTGAQIPAATQLLAGVLTKDDKIKLDGLDGSAYLQQVNLAYVDGGSQPGGVGGTGIITNDTGGTNATIPAATTTNAGLMTDSQVTQLESLAAAPGAQPTNLAYSETTGVGGEFTGAEVSNSNGTGFTIPAAAPGINGLIDSETWEAAKDLADNKGDYENITPDLTYVPAPLGGEVEITAGTESGTSASIPVVVSSDTSLAYPGTAGLMIPADKEKLDGIEPGAQVNVKPNWNADELDPDGILNKPLIADSITAPNLSSYPGEGYQDPTTGAPAPKDGTIVELTWTNTADSSNGEAEAYITPVNDTFSGVVTPAQKLVWGCEDR